MPELLPFLIVDVRHDPIFTTSPPYQALIAWCEVNGIPLVTGWTLTVWDESPVRAVLDIIDLNENDAWVLGEDGLPVTHPVTYEADSQAPVSGHVYRGDST